MSSNILKGIIVENEQTSYGIYLTGSNEPLLKYYSIPELKAAYYAFSKKYPDKEFIVKKTTCATTDLGAPELLEDPINEDLRKWFKEKWVRFGPDGKIRGDCARGDDSEGKPKCLPQAKAHSLGKKGRKYAAAKKRREDPNPERSGKAINVSTKKKSNEGAAPGSEEKDPIWNKGTPMPKDYTCHCGLYVHPSVRNPKAIHTPDCPYAEKKDVAEGSEYTPPKLGTVKAHIMNTAKPTVQVQVFKHNTLRGDSYWVTKEVKTFKTMDQAKAYVDRINKQDVAEEQLDELKCWPGYTRVQGVPAGAPGSCKKKTDETVEEGLTKQARAKKEAEAVIAAIKRLESELKDPNPYIDREDIQRRLDTEKRRLELYRDVLDEQDIKEEKCPHCAGPMFSEELMMEKKDACYYKVKSRYKVWPSAYASGALVKCRKKGAKNWGNKSESVEEASSSAQQAAIAISMKKAHKKPKQESAIMKGLQNETKNENS